MIEKIKNIYNSMSNRVLAFFVLLIILFIFWWMLFMKFSEEEKNTKEKVEIEKTNIKKITFEKQKKDEKKELTNRQKIEKLKRNLRWEKAEAIFDNYEIILKKNKKKVFVFLKNNKTKKLLEILNFKNYNENKKQQVDVFFDKIYSKNKQIYIFFNKNLYFYNIENKNLQKINFEISPKYIKKITNKKYVIVTEKGSFIYDFENKTIEYFYLFKDFIIYKNNYIWIIYNSEKNKKKNIWLEKYNSDILVEYNLKTKEKKVILENIKEFERIILNNRKIYIFSNWEKYVLKNFF